MRLIGALFLVLSIMAVINYGPGGTLAGVLYQVSPAALVNLQSGIQRNLSPGLWSGFIQPVLMMPAWLPPMLIGVVFFLVGVGSQERRR